MVFVPERIAAMRIHSRCPIRVLSIFTLTVALTIGITNVAYAAVFRCTSGDVFCLIGSIRSANERPGRHRIILEPGTYTLTVIDNPADSSNGGNALPSVTSRLTIEGAGPGDTIIQGLPSEALTLRIFHVAETGTLELRRLTIIGEARGGDFGSAIFNSGTLTISQSVIRDSLNDFGIGAVFSLGTLRIADSRIFNNSGGALLALDGPTSIARSTIENNGLGFCNGIDANFGTVTIEDSTISGNASLGSAAGGLCVFDATATIINTTIVNNVGGSFGGILVNGGTVRLINVTVADNVSGSDGGGGIFAFEGSTVLLQNTILARNVSQGLGPDCLGSITSLGNNVIGDTADCTIDLLASDHVGASGLGEFVDSETPGRGHIPLLPGSPAIDAGNRQACPRRDQLQNRRVDGDGDHRKICDIGSVEFTTDTDTDLD
jgi:hypothetical protein